MSKPTDSNSTPPEFSVCVFCGSKQGADTHWMSMASDAGTQLARRSIRVVYGGGGIGLMGAVAGAALDHGGQVIGVIPESLMAQEVGKHQVTRLERVDSMATRKTRMIELSDAFLVLPGGLGTLDEWFEVLTLRQIGDHDKPIAVLNYRGYFDSVLAAIEDFTRAGFVKARDTEHMLIGDELGPLLESLQSVAD